MSGSADQYWDQSGGAPQQESWRDSDSLAGPGGRSSAWRDSGSVDTTYSAVNDNPGLTLFFKVTLEVVDLGYWTKVSGLGMTINTDHRGDSAMSFFQHHLPGHMQYEQLVLERPVSADTSTVMNWISAYHMLPIPTTGNVSCVDQKKGVVMNWDIFGVSPISWKGPSFDANTTNVANEVLTLAHMGFM